MKKSPLPMSKGVRTDRHTDTKVNTENTLSWFQDVFLQPRIKDRSKKKTTKKQTDRHKVTRRFENKLKPFIPLVIDQGAVKYIHFSLKRTKVACQEFTKL